ncbi:class I SAM-dependent rRNA methyltransferase [Criblamydia sequanensis]|uniref:PUA domain-containing protein n=1 Tax=Candidatus Criblamydia sequanensis CRIB-18 TaxID=1437425 RepID=A0A090D181_9BACT|nr:class I SAM-dependent rRNA methyltransferase [Criblamydia sequanensis]CDR33378.1 Conserved hypothetical protein [Criblamydia sequanensis CRIB-18]
MNRVILKKGKERAVKFRHPWIFSGAIKEISPCEDGVGLPVYSESGELLGHGYVNRKSDITVRMLSFDDTPCERAIEENLKEALELREELFKGKETTAYRVINSEGDGIPGLIIDRFNEVVVLQIGTLGIRKLKKTIIDLIIKHMRPKAIVEKSNLPSLKKEGLKSEEGLLYGEWDEELVIKENGLSFKVDIQKGQKTGFFLDHREMRNKISELSKGKTVLNAFCYSGAFSVYSLKGGALKVDSVDISKEAILLARENVALNGFSNNENEFIADDVFTFLREKPLDYDIVILDPPAFAKLRKDVDAACRGYKDINRLAFSKAKKGSILLTCSCSYHVNADLFQQVIFQAALEAKRKVRIIGRHELAKDHPISIYHPEGDYLKSLLLYVS